MMKAGAGKARIELPPELFPIETFRTVAAPLHLRALLLEDEAGARAALVSYELTSLRGYAVAAAKATVQALTGIPAERIWVCVSHTFSAPHTRSENAMSAADAALRHKNELLCQALDQALRTAVQAAAGAMQAAQMRGGAAQCQFNCNRDLEGPDGWWHGPDTRGCSDHEIPLVRFDRLDGTPLALFYACDVQSSLTENTGVVSSDLLGCASLWAEEHCPGLVAVGAVGTAGDQMPAPGTALQALGQTLGQALLAARLDASAPACTLAGAEKAISVAGQKPPMDMRMLHPDRCYRYQPDADRTTLIKALTLGDVAVVGVKPELNSTTGHTIRQTSPYRRTLVLTMVDGGEKYMADSRSYERCTYEAMNSQFGQGSAEQLAQAIHTLLQQCKGGKA